MSSFLATLLATKESLEKFVVDPEETELQKRVRKDDSKLVTVLCEEAKPASFEKEKKLDALRSRAPNPPPSSPALPPPSFYYITQTCLRNVKPRPKVESPTRCPSRYACCLVLIVPPSSSSKLTPSLPFRSLLARLASLFVQVVSSDGQEVFFKIKNTTK